MGPPIVMRLTTRGDQDLATLVRQGLPDRGMPPTAIADAELAALLKFLRTIERAPESAPLVRARVQTTDGRTLEGQVLDETLEKWASDVDLTWRGHVLGWRSAYEPRARGWHIRSYSPSTRAAVPPRDRRIQFRNRYLMMAANDTPAGLARDLPRILAYEVLALGHVLLRERHLLRGYVEARRLLPRARRRRELIDRKLRESGRGRCEVPFGLEPTP